MTSMTTSMTAGDYAEPARFTESAKSARDPARDPAQVKLRFRGDQVERIQRLADAHQTTFSAEVKWLIDRGLDHVTLRNIEAIAMDLELNWARFSERFLALELEGDILTALESRRYEEARIFAAKLRRVREAQARSQAEKLNGGSGR
jgi:hypothetical protein